MIKSTLKKYLINSFEIEIDFLDNIDFNKILKNSSKVKGESINNNFIALNKIIKSDKIKEMFIIYKKSILDFLRLNEIENFTNNKIHLFEICDKKSQIDYNDNILVFGEEITQIRVEDFFNLLINNSIFYENDKRELYVYLIKKILFYSINRKEVEIMKKYSEEVSELLEIMNNKLNLNLDITSDYI